MADSASLKRSKLSSISDEDGVIDRISNLPNSLLSHVLSFLPTKYAVRTSILSTRWEFVWTYIINLDFDDESDLHKINNNNVENVEKFRHFVYRVLLLLKQQRLHKFSLYTKRHDNYVFRHVNNWVSTAIERGVQELDLNVYYFEMEEKALPRRLFNCTSTLKVLKLSGYWYIRLSKYSVSFPRLKILHLIGVVYDDVESLTKLFSGCPVLEDLVMEDCDAYAGSKINITCSSLKRLKLSNETCGVLEINTPALEYLDLEGIMLLQISLMTMVSLVDAKIDACISEKYDYDNVLLQLFKGLCNTKFLSLSRRTMEALSLASDQLVLPKFDNLIQLKVSFKSKSDEWKPLSSLLAKSVNLKELICNE